MLKRNLRAVVRQTLQIGITVMLLCGFVSAQNSKTPLSSEDYYKRGVTKMKNDKCVEAIIDFGEAIYLNPREARFFLKRGECFDTLSEMKNAVGDFSRAIELKPDFIEAYLARARIYATYYEKDGEIVKTPIGAAALVNPGQAGKVLADFNQALKINPRSSDAFLARAIYYFQPLEDFKSALADLNKAVEINPRSAEAFIDRANFYFSALEDHDKALADSATAIKLNPRNASVYEFRAVIYSFIGKNKQAIADYTAALKLKPNNPELFSSRAQAYRRIGKIRLAEADERKVEKLLAKAKQSGVRFLIAPIEESFIKPEPPTEQELLDSYIQSWKEEVVLISRAKEEIKTWTKVLETYPRYVNGLFERGNNYLAVRDYEKAITDYSQAINITPEDYQLFNNRGIAYARKGDYDLAIKDFSAAISLNSDQEKGISYNRGLALFSKGDAEKSIEDFTQVLKVRPKWDLVYRLRAKAYRKLGKIAEAEADEAMAKRLEEN